jgi:hypothetical protein
MLSWLLRLLKEDDFRGIIFNKPHCISAKFPEPIDILVFIGRFCPSIKIRIKMCESMGFHLNLFLEN